MKLLHIKITDYKLSLFNNETIFDFFKLKTFLFLHVTFQVCLSQQIHALLKTLSVTSLLIAKLILKKELSTVHVNVVTNQLLVLILLVMKEIWYKCAQVSVEEIRNLNELYLKCHVQNP